MHRAPVVGERAPCGAPLAAILGSGSAFSGQVLLGRVAGSQHPMAAPPGIGFPGLPRYLRAKRSTRAPHPVPPHLRLMKRPQRIGRGDDTKKLFNAQA